MFLAGADQSKAELRAPSIKGAMRFWWRAMNGHLGLKELKEKETEIFGGGGDNARKSSFSIRVKEKISNSRKPFPKHKVTVVVKHHSERKEISINILDYLAYGVNEYQKGEGQVIIRDYIKPGSKCNVEITFNSNVSSETIAQVTTAFYLMAILGGLGSKSRNGFGRFKILNDSNYSFEFLKQILERKKSFSRTSWLAFSKDVKVFQTNETQKWDEALSLLGKAYKTARENLEHKHNYNRRKYLSAPIMVNKINRADLERHSKTLFLTVLEKNEKYIGLVVVMPYNYLDGYEGKISNNALQNYLNVINNFTDNLKNTSLLEVQL